MAGQTTASHARGNVLVALLHELLRAKAFTCYADLLDALKTRAARLRIPYDGPAVDDALRQVEHRLGHPVVTSPVTQPQPPAPSDLGLSHDESVAMLSAAGVVRYMKTMAAVRPLTDDEQCARSYRVEQRRAYRLVQQAILDTAQRVAQLEDAVETADREADR